MAPGFWKVHRDNFWGAASCHPMVPILRDVRGRQVLISTCSLSFYLVAWYSTCSTILLISSISNSTLTHTTRARFITSAPSSRVPNGACPSLSPGSSFSTCMSRWPSPCPHYSRSAHSTQVNLSHHDICLARGFPAIAGSHRATFPPGHTLGDVLGGDIRVACSHTICPTTDADLPP